MRLCVLARHGESEYNVLGLLNGDPAVNVALSPRGSREAHELGIYLAQVSLAVCLHTRFPRTLQTARVALGAGGRTVPLACEPGLDDIHIGDLEGRPAEDYRAWKSTHGRDATPPGGESVRDAARRYAEALRRLSSRTEEHILVICHELPLRYAINAAMGSEDISGPEHEVANAVPYLFEATGLRRAAERIRAEAEGPWGTARPAA